MYKTLITRRELDILEANIADPDKWGCELYTAQISTGGAGQIKLRRLGKKVSAHRIFYSLRRKDDERPITEDDFICHDCSSHGRPGKEPRNCITHLKRMSREEHVRDTVEKGQYRRGARHRDAKLGDHVVFQLRELYVAEKLPLTHAATARMLGVAWSSLYYALIGKTYKHVPMPERSTREEGI